MRELPPRVKHNNPEDYGLINEEAWKMRLKYLCKQEKEYEQIVSGLASIIMKASAKDAWLPQMYWMEQKEKLDNIRKKISYTKSLLRNEINEQKFDLEYIKQIPISQIVEVGKNNFFKLRDEKTASVYWYKSSNTFYDFGTCEGGDVIDLFIKLNSCNFVEACKALTQF